MSAISFKVPIQSLMFKKGIVVKSWIISKSGQTISYKCCSNVQIYNPNMCPSRSKLKLRPSSNLENTEMNSDWERVWFSFFCSLLFLDVWQIGLDYYKFHISLTIDIQLLRRFEIFKPIWHALVHFTLLINIFRTESLRRPSSITFVLALSANMFDQEEFWKKYTFLVLYLIAFSCCDLVYEEVCLLFIYFLLYWKLLYTLSL